MSFWCVLSVHFSAQLRDSGISQTSRMCVLYVYDAQMSYLDPWMRFFDYAERYFLFFNANCNSHFRLISIGRLVVSLDSLCRPGDEVVAHRRFSEN